MLYTEIKSKTGTRKGLHLGGGRRMAALKCKKCGSEDVYAETLRGGRGIRIPGGVCKACREKENAAINAEKHTVTEEVLQRRMAAIEKMPSYSEEDKVSIEKYAMPLIRQGLTSLNDWNENAPKGWIGRDYFLFDLLTRGHKEGGVE